YSMTDLDKQLQQMALMNWRQFASIMGADAIKRAKICLLRQQGNKYDYICKVLDLSKNQVQYACTSCEKEV
ncbi:MAG TPA: hypothetical protein PLV31_01385, partial [Gammaproteobacteria bacterium]|nr:hypothetical protein [Gammaproteobacteria bacterium]HRB44169.1 hypothetical protein [Niabella sp.]